MKKVIIIFSFMLFSLSCFSSGKALFIKGAATLNNQPLKKGQTINKGDIVKTAKDSLLVIKFDGGSTIKVNSDSEVKVSVHNSKKKATLFQLIKGSGFFSLDPKEKGKLNVKTKYGSMGVRGTRFFVAYGEADKDVFMCVNEGSVWVKDQKEKVVTVKEGEGVVMGTTVSNPQFLPWTKNLNWKLDPKSGSLENSAKIEENYKNPLKQDYD